MLRRSVLSIAVLSAALVWLASASPRTAEAQGGGGPRFGPLHFVENVGQWDARARFRARIDGLDVWLTRNRMVFQDLQRTPGSDDADVEPAASEGHALALRFLGTAGATTIRASEPYDERYHYLRGEGGLSGSDAQAYRTLVYEDLYEGIDMIVEPAEGRRGGFMKTTYVVAPGADPEQILYEYEGATSVRGFRRGGEGVTWNETVLVETPLGELQEIAPAIYQIDENGDWVVLEGGFVVDEGFVSFEVPGHDTSRPLYIDPVFIYSRAVGGGQEDWIYQIQEDATGVYAVGTTESTDFPVTAGAFQVAPGGSEDAFAAKFDPTDGDLIWATYVGGDDFDRFTDFLVIGGEIVATGYADTDGQVQFPTTAGVYQENPVKDDFHPVLTRLAANGASLVWSTFVASTAYTPPGEGTQDDDDYGLGIAQAQDGGFYVVGTTEADGGWPTGTGIWDQDPDGSTSGSDNDNGFALKVPDGGATISDFTYVGGDNDDATFDVEVDAAGDVYFVSVTESTDFPTSGGAFQTMRDPGQSSSSMDDLGVTKLDAGLDTLRYSTYLTGNDDDQGTITVSYSPFTDDRPVWHGLALVGERAVVAGTTESTNYPTTAGSWQPSDLNGGTDDGFATILNETGTDLIASSYLGTATSEEVFGSPVEVDGQGNVYVGGATSADTGFPIVAAVQPVYGGSSFGDGFTTIFSPDLSALVCSSYLGGSDSERVLGILAGPAPRFARYTGYTNSPDFPETDPTIGLPTGGFPDRNGFIASTTCTGASLILVPDSDEVLPDTDGRACLTAGDYLDYRFSITNDADSAQPDLAGPELAATISGAALLECTASSGGCSVGAGGLSWNGSVGPGEVIDFVVRARVLGGTPAGTEICLNSVLSFDGDAVGANTSTRDFELCGLTDCEPTVSPNEQLGGQVHLPILDFQGQDDVCDTWVEIQNVGPDFVKASLVVWGEPGFCPPQAAGPLKVECTGLLKPGSTWNLLGAQIPSGSKSGIVFKFTAKQLSELGLDLGEDDIVADFLCESLFFGIVGDADDYRRFKKAYNEGLTYDGVPLDLAAGEGILAIDVLRSCPGDITPGVKVTSKYNGIAGTHLGEYDPVFGGYGYFVPLVYAEKAGFHSILYIQNGGLDCSSVEIWFRAQDDCLRRTVCDVATLAPGETYQMDANDCVGPDFQGSAFIRTSQPMGIAVDIVGRDVLMTYVGEPSEINYTFDPSRAISTGGNQVAFGPLIYSEYQGWDTGVQVQNMSAATAAKVKVYFLDRSGDIITTLVDWICPRGSQTYFLPVIFGLPGSWVGSVRVESQEWFTPGSPLVLAPNIIGVATLMKYTDVARTETTQAIAYNLLPEHKIYDWQIGFGAGGLDSGVGLIAIPSLLKDPIRTGVSSEIAIANVVPKPGFTDFVIYLYDQNGLLDYVCQKLNEKQVEYIDLNTWGYVDSGFKGSAIISAWFWEHDVFDNGGFFLRNLVGLGAVAVERSGARLGEDVAGDEAAGSRGIPFREQDIEGEDLEFAFMGPVPLCPGFPDTDRGEDCPEEVVAQCVGCPRPIPDPGSTSVTFEVELSPLCRVTDVDLRLDVQHQWIGDLDVNLVSPGRDSIRSELFTDICGNFGDLDVLLDDDAAAPIGSVCSSPLTGTFATESGDGLSVFEGEAAGGDWVLQIADDFGGSNGEIQDAQLILGTESR